MKVKSLKMQNFRGFENLTLDFSETESTVFFGINGVGKSSILDCLSSLLLIYYLGIKDSFFDALLEDSKKNQSKPGSKIVGDYIQLDWKDILNNTDTLLSKITVVLDSHKDATWCYQLLRGGRVEFIYEKDVLLPLFDSVRADLRTNPEANLSLLVYYPVDREFSQVSLEVIQDNWNQQIAVSDNFFQGAKIGFESFFRWYRITEDLENEKRSENSDYLNRQLQSVRNAIYQLIPTFSNLRVRRSPPLRMTVNKKLGDQEQELTINQLSDGEKCLLAMVGDIARRLAIGNPGLENPLEGEGVVLIDEIELHLHPAWQRQIIPALTRTFPNCQFICTTHSPQVLSELMPESIYCLERTEEGQVIAYHPDNPYGKDSNYILEVLMGVTERPKRIKEQLLELFRLIETGQLEEAKRLQRRLETEIGEDEPEFARADVLIRRREAIGR